jgi:hypothetical protein
LWSLTLLCTIDVIFGTIVPLGLVVVVGGGGGVLISDSLDGDNDDGGFNSHTDCLTSGLLAVFLQQHNPIFPTYINQFYFTAGTHASHKGLN